MDLVHNEKHPPSVESSEATQVYGNGLLAMLTRFEAQMDKKLGLESEAIERKRPEDKTHKPWHEQLSMALIWASASLTISCFATGFLGWELGLSLGQAIIITILGAFIGGGAAAYCATFGAATGLRQMSVSRYSLGWYPNKIVALLNSIQSLGWASVSCIAAGLALTAVADGHVSLFVGIIINAIASLVISLFGLNVILVYERYAWFIYFLIFMVILGMTGKYADNTTPSALTGSDLSGTMLTLFAIMYGGSASWCTVASDYYVHYPANTSRIKVFILATLGIAIPTSVGMVAGCVVASSLNNRPDWAAAYDRGIGYLILDMLFPSAFAKLVLVLLVLSGINLSVVTIYSASISFQQICTPFARIPRFIWSIFGFAIILGLALGGRERLSVFLQDFLSLLGYWLTSYFVIIFEEHVIFRKGSFDNYDLEAWNDRSRLPMGIGASVAFGISVIAWVMGMNETWYTGPLAVAIGGDVGSEFAFVVTALVYIPARWAELRYFGR